MSKINPKYRPYSFGKRQLLFLFLFLLIVFLLILTPFVPEIVSGDFEEVSKEYLGDNYKAILIAAFVLGTTILAYFTVDLSGFIGGSKKQRLEALTIPWSLEKEAYVKAAKEAAKQSELEEAIKNLYKLKVEALDEELHMISSRLAKYNRETIQGTSNYENQSVAYNRLIRDVLKTIDGVEKSLKEEGTINSTIKEYLLGRYENRLRQKLADRQPINISKSPSSEGTSETTSSYFVTLPQEDVQAEIKNIFEEAKGRLLITGNPGAGKTVVMLQLVIALLKEKQSAIPILLNLATWQSSFYKLEAWLEEILPAEMGMNKTLAKKMLKEIPLILLLDGLDEVKEEDRNSCLKAIGFYGANARHRFVIATRKQEYMAVSKDAPVFMQIEVEPLQIEQIKEELKRIGYEQPESLPLLSALEKNGQLQEILKTPFYFNILQLLFAQGMRLHDLNLSSNCIDKSQQKIIHQFVDIQLSKKFNRSKSTKKWLMFLANRMKKRNLVVFELKDLQSDWAKLSGGQLRLTILTSELVEGFLEIIIVLMIIFVMFGLIGVVFGEYGKEIATKSLARVMIWVFIGAIMFITSKEKLPKITTKDEVKWSYNNFVSSLNKSRNVIISLVLFFGLTFGLLFSLATGSIFSLVLTLVVSTFLVGLVFGLHGMLTENYSHFINIDSPYKRFIASMNNLHFSIFQHLLLRYQLSRKGLLPFKLIEFLNDMTQNHLLETDGATWRFRHRILQDYFADLWEEEYAGEYEEK